MRAMAQARFPIGTSDFRKLRQQGLIYVDKSAFICDVIDSSAEVLLIPRPRRFGKTLNLSALRYFLERSAEDRAPLFVDLAVWRSEAARAHFARYPVIALSFKDVKASSFEDARRAVGQELRLCYQDHAYLLEGGALSAEDRERFQAILRGEGPPASYAGALRDLSAQVAAHHRQPVVILIDEYDTPIHAGFLGGYYDEIALLCRNLLSGGLKDNPHLFKGVLTGVLRVAKESLFSGLNNLAVYGLLQGRFAAHFGFTESDVEELRGRLGSARPMSELRRWYNGYDFGGQVIYNPWSVVNALGNGDEPLQPYWVNTASDELLQGLLLHFGAGEQGEMAALLRGEGVRKVLREDVALRDLYRDPDTLWSFLLFTGYLKAEQVEVAVEGPRSQTLGTLRLPNLEVGTVFGDLFDRWLRQGVGGETRRQDLIRALLTGDLPRFQEHLQRLLVESASFHDLVGERRRMPPEHVYQVFILGLLVSLPRHIVTANREGGHGRYDVMIAPKEPGQPGVVLELKVKGRGRGETLGRALAAAKRQLREQDYAAPLRAQGASPIQQVAVAFDGKRVLVGGAEEAAAPRRRAR